MGSLTEPTWLKILIALFSGGLLVKLFEYFYIQKVVDRKSATQLINKNLDPIIKAANDLVGKISYLARSDFGDFKDNKRTEELELSAWFTYLDTIYLFTQLWARIQILRLEGLYINLSLNKHGARLLDFIDALETRKNGIVKRAWQRGMGELLIEQINDKYYSMTFAEFADNFLSDAEFRRWFDPLVSLLENLKYRKNRQKILLYGVIVHAMLNTIDEKHQVTRRKIECWPNKLSGKSRNDLKFLIFKEHLNFVKIPEQYYLVQHNNE
ncbi:MAG: hypothetical protein HQ562_00730 [Candidatus Marinimicrobia bacterium]|nr:hypothetical protein [Candidatus Neomarinimicrobiota bacterium]